MKKAVSPTSIDTLVSKIILGTLGTVPAYDRFFKITAENLGICKTLNSTSLDQLQKFIDANKDDIDKIIEDNKLNYTQMKIVDIYFWQKAYNLSPIHRTIDLAKKDYSAKINKQIKEQIEKCKTLNQTLYNKLVNLPLKNKDNYKNIISICEKIIKDYYNDAIVIDLQNYQDEDYEFVYDTKKSLYKDYVIQNWSKWIEKDQKGFFEKYIKTNKEHIYILTSGNTKIGFIDYNIGQSNVDIGNLCINKEHQGKSIGSRILEEIINQNLDKTISLQVFIQNERAIKLYNKLGFKISSSSNTHHTMILEPRI
jgi:RimJ/RimL family protein N-acetyltransferase